MLYELLDELKKAIEETDLKKAERLFRCLEMAGMDRKTVIILLKEIKEEMK